jgi:hypothetical protein
MVERGVGVVSASCLLRWFFGCERDTWVFFGLIGMVWAGLGCMVFSCYSYTSLMN